MSSTRDIVNLVAKLRYESSSEARSKTFANVLRAMDESKHEKPMTQTLHVRRAITIRNNLARAAALVAIAVVLVGGLTFWPSGAKNAKWWLGPSAAWGQEILNSLDRIEAVVYRQRIGRVSEYGPPQMSVGWERHYNAKDRYRRDRYDDGVNIMNTQWVVPDGNGLLMIEVSYEYKCYFQRSNERYGFIENIIDQMRSYVRLLDKADRILQTEVFDGRECVGFEISTAKYGDNPKGPFNRIWFDVETKLPMRIEHHKIPNNFDAGETYIIIHDQLEYHAQVPIDLFTPKIPEGFANAHPDEIRAARDRQIKGEMVFTEVPAGLKDEIISVLRQVNVGSYRRGQTCVYFSKSAWREEHYVGQHLQEINWYVQQGELLEGPFEPQDNLVLTETKIDFNQRNYQIIPHDSRSRPRHPMSSILFVAGLIDKADRYFDYVEIDGRACFGFEVSAKKYGDNPDGMLHRVWFDSTTKLPVRIELQYPADASGQIPTIVKDQFQWNSQLPDDTFNPVVPSDFQSATPQSTQ
jgi:outer membrane lipoprotein-sorting protein